MHFPIAVSLLLANQLLAVTALPAEEIEAPTMITHMGDEVQEMGLVVFDDVQLNSLQKREPFTLTVALTAAATAAIGWATTQALDSIKKQVAKVGDKWTAIREEATKATTSEMWRDNLDRNTYKAAICYNMAYDVSSKDHISALGNSATKGTTAQMHVKHKVVVKLFADYDCFFLARGGTVTIKGDGGFINLAMVKDNSCTYSKPTGQKHWQLKC